MLSAHAILHTYDCVTPGCPHEARSNAGAERYCDACQARRRLGGQQRIIPGTPQWYRWQVSKAARRLALVESQARVMAQRLATARRELDAAIAERDRNGERAA